MESFRDRVAVITGAASGIGLGLIARAAQEGMKVVMTDVDASGLEAAADGLRKNGADVLAVTADVSRADDVTHVAERAIARFGAIHLLCNNAGVGVAGPRTWELTLTDWEWTLGVNLWGVIHGIQTFLPLMLERGEPGHIVNTASAAGLASPQGMAAYNVSKHGVVTLSETLHHELKAHGAPIGVSVLCPGMVQTRILEAERNRPGILGNDPAIEAHRERAYAAFEESMRAAMKRGLTPADVAATVFEGVRAGSFYLLTHDWIRQVVRTRLMDITLDRPPTDPS